jgi:hypothetical protein
MRGCSPFEGELDLFKAEVIVSMQLEGWQRRIDVIAYLVLSSKFGFDSAKVTCSPELTSFES